MDELMINIEGIEYAILTSFEVKERTYIALMDDKMEIQIFKYNIINDDNNEGIEITSIKSDMEFEEVIKEFENLLDETTESN